MRVDLPAAPVEREVDALVDHVVAEALGDALELDHLVARARGHGEAEVYLLVGLGQHDELALEALDALHALLDLLGLGGLVAEPLYERGHVGDVALLCGALGPQLLQVVLALPQVARVGARIGVEALVLERGHVAHAGVHEGAVVAHEQDRPRIGGQESLEPLDALEVKVVGGLVEQEQVGVAQQELRERDAHLPASREVDGALVEVVHGKAEAGQDRAGPALELVSPQALEAVLGLAVALEEALLLGTLARGGDLVLETLDLVFERADLRGRRHHLGERRALPRDLGLLLQVADGGAAREGHGALVGRLLAHDDLEQRRLAGPVRAHERPALAGVELQRGARVEELGAERL